jgi:hypothetical protein
MPSQKGRSNIPRRFHQRPGAKVAMTTLDRHQALLRRQWAEELKALERRRQVVLGAATEAGQALRHRWPASVTIPISISP